MLTSVFCISVSASGEASYYLDSYVAGLTAQSGGRIAITVDVAGTGYMEEIGATEIHLYESTDNVRFDWVASFYVEDYPEMMGSGYDYYDTPVTYYGVPGRYYDATVYVYAGNGSRGDSAMYETVSCRAIS